MLPTPNLKGGILAAKLLNVNVIEAILVGSAGNILPIPFVLMFTKKAVAFLKHRGHMTKFVVKLEKKMENNKEKILRYEYLGLFAIVASSLPGMGGWSGAIVAAMLEMDVKKSLIIITSGIFCSAIILSLLIYGGAGLINLLR